MDHFRQTFHFGHIFRIIASTFPLLLILRLFKAFDAQPRLALVTHTLEAAAKDVGHFLIVFFAIFLTFVVMSMALYGREIDEFASFPRAFHTCFVVLMGDFDMDEMLKIGAPMAGLWFWAFQMIINLLLLNMLL